MSFVIEDGTGVSGAVSYASADDMYLYAVSRGIEIPQDISVLEALLMKGMDYLRKFNNSYRGSPVNTSQRTGFPRTWYVGNSQVNSGLPMEIKEAQIIAALAAMKIDLMPVPAAASPQKTRQTVGPITVEYAESGSTTKLVEVPEADMLLRPFLNRGFGQPSVVRG